MCLWLLRGAHRFFWGTGKLFSKQTIISPMNNDGFIRSFQYFYLLLLFLAL